MDKAHSYKYDTVRVIFLLKTLLGQGRTELDKKTADEGGKKTATLCIQKSVSMCIRELPYKG